MTEQLTHAPAKPAAASSSTQLLRLWLLTLVLSLTVGLLVGLFVGGAAYEPAQPGLPETGAVVGWGLPVAKLLSTVFGTATLGLLLNAAFLWAPGRAGVVSRIARRDLVRASALATAWCIASLAAFLFSHATAMGRPLLSALDPSTFWTFAFSIPTNVAFFLMACIAAFVALGSLLTSRVGPAGLLTAATALGLILPPLNAHGSGSGDHGLALLADSVHAIAAAVWIGSLSVLIVHIIRGTKGAEVALQRFSPLAFASVVALFVSGLGTAYVRLERFSDLWQSSFGLLVLLKAALLGLLVVVAAQIRIRLRTGVGQRRPKAVLSWLVTETVLLAAAIGLGVSLTLTAYPRADVPLNSPGEELLGFNFPPEPDLVNVLFGWYPEPFWLLVGLALAVLYGLGLRRLRHKQVKWPVGRTIAWFLGVTILTWATSFGLAGYGLVSIGWHMVQHMVISMLVPILLVLGMPVTLALRALKSNREQRGPREWLLWGIHSPVSKFATHPLYVLVVGTFGLFGLYFTPLFATAMTGHVGHLLMMIHFVASGFLFYWVVLGLDPGPRQVPAMYRLLLLLLFMSFHAFFAIAIMTSTEPLGAAWYGEVQPPWLPDLVADTTISGGVAWAFGEIPTLIVIIVVAVQWARSDAREAKRIDRQAERDGYAELQAYNEYLQSLSNRRGQG